VNYDLELSKHFQAIADLLKERANLDLQSPTIRGEAKTEAQRENESYLRDPLAKSMADLVTPKQLGMIRALSRGAGVDAEEECQKVLRCRTDELSKRAASSLIDHLKNLQGESGDMRRAS
jgi:hypothetical protein